MSNYKSKGGDAAGKQHPLCQYLEMEGDMDMEVIRPHAMRHNALSMNGEYHSMMIIKLCTHIFADLNDSNVQTRYLMLMNVALQKDITAAHKRSYNIENFTFGNSAVVSIDLDPSKNSNKADLNNNTSKTKVDIGAGKSQEDQNNSINSSGGLFAGLLQKMVATKVVQDAVVSSFREVIGTLMSSSISVLDAGKINHQVVGGNSFNNREDKLGGGDTAKEMGASAGAVAGQGGGGEGKGKGSRKKTSETSRPFVQALNLFHPLELNPEPYLVAEEMCGSMANNEEAAESHAGDRSLLNSRMYRESQEGDRELYNAVNQRATTMMNINQKWFSAFLRFFQTMPVGLRWLCNQFSVHLAATYSRGKDNTLGTDDDPDQQQLRIQTTIAVLDFVFTEMVLPVLHNDQLWVDVAVKGRWGATVENRTDSLYWTGDRIRSLQLLWKGDIRQSVKARVRRNLFWATNMLHRTIVNRPMDDAAAWLVGVNRSISMNTQHGVLSARKVLEAAGDLDLQNTMLTDMFREHVRKEALVLQMPIVLIEYLRYILLLMGPKYFHRENIIGRLVWSDKGILGDEGMRNAARTYDPYDKRYAAYPVFVNYSLDLAHQINMGTGNEDSSMLWEEDTTVVSTMTRCILPRKLAVGRPHSRFLFGDNMTNIARDDASMLSLHDEQNGSSDDSDDDEDGSSNFGSVSENQARKSHRIQSKTKERKILLARHKAHIKARDALQDFLRDPSTAIGQLIHTKENPVFLMMRLVRARQYNYEMNNKYDEAQQCAAVASSLEQLVMQAKPLSTILLEILQALSARKDRAISLELSFRHSDRLQIEFRTYDAWLLNKLKEYSKCIDYVRYGIKESQNRQLVVPVANRKGILLTKADLVRSVHEKVPKITSTMNKYGQVHGGHYVYPYSRLKDLGVIRELRLDVPVSNGGETTATAASSEKNAAVTLYEKLDPNDVKIIMKSLEYEFTIQGGVINIICVYSKSYVIDIVQFPVLALQKAMKIGEAAFEPNGSHTSYGTSDLLKLVMDISLRSLLL